MPGLAIGRSHGGVRGASYAPHSQTFEGRFGRLFRRLRPATFSERALHALAELMVAKAEDSPTPETEVDNEENQGIAAGYTYLGQFIDHDLTFDPASSLMKQNDLDALVDFRSPAFDLDNLYGRGPDDQPYLYEADGRHLQQGRPLTGNPTDSRTRDVPRHTSATGTGELRARALIGDPRNDENVIISQLQGVLMRFHNKMVDEHPSEKFERIQELVRWHYQWVVLTDFLPTIVGPAIVHSILPHLESGKSMLLDRPQLRFYRFRNSPFIPVEFSAAAYRFGHSMVRPIYRLNTTLGVTPPPAGDPVNGRQFIFHPEDDNLSLNGFRAFPSNWAIEWNLYFDFGDHLPNVGVKRLQRAYKIDTSLVNPLGLLPISLGFEERQRSLAFRNLQRGVSLGLPSGQDVARALGEDVISDDLLKVGKATADDTARNPKLVDIRELGHEFKHKAPLWYYVLAEAQQQFKKDDTPIRLGPVGGRIVAETFIGLLLGDPHSFLSKEPHWRPNKAGKFAMADLIKKAIS
jgi:hypothetical protein